MLKSLEESRPVVSLFLKLYKTDFAQFYDLYLSAENRSSRGELVLKAINSNLVTSEEFYRYLVLSVHYILSK